MTVMKMKTRVTMTIMTSIIAKLKLLTLKRGKEHLQLKRLSKKGRFKTFSTINLKKLKLIKP